MLRKQGIRCTRCRAASATRTPLPPWEASARRRKKRRSRDTATARRNWTSWTRRKRSASDSSRKWRNWNARWRSPGGTSIHTPMATMHLRTVRLMEAVAWATLRRTTSPVTWRKSNAAATRGRKPSGAALGSATRKRRRRPKGSVPTRWRESARKKRNETARTLSSSLPVPMRTSSIRWPLPTVRRKPD